VPVFDIEQSLTGTIFAATHGRGAYSLGGPTPIPTATGTQLPTATPTGTVTPAPTMTITATPSATATITQTPSPTATTTHTITPTPTVTATPSVTATATATRTATATLTPTSTVTRTATATATTIATPSPTGTATHTVTATPTITATPTATVTPVITVLSISPKKIKFPSQVFGGSGATSPLERVTVVNPTANRDLPPVVLGPIAVKGDFAIDPGTSSCVSGATLAASASCRIGLTFTPNALGLHVGSLTVNGNGRKAPQTVALRGTGVAGDLDHTPTALHFGKVVLGLNRGIALVLKNPNRAPLLVTAITAGLSDYAVGSGCIGVLPALGSCSVMITFAPSTVGSKPTTLVIHDDAAHSPQTIALEGSGKKPPAPSSP